MSRIDEIKEMMRAFLNEEEEEVPLDYQDIELIYKELCKEKLTDQEQRIFLSAMTREEKICKEIDHAPDYTMKPNTDVVQLVPIVKSIERKVKMSLF